MPTSPTAAALFRDVGLLADGPAPFGRAAGARGPGILIVELGSPLPRAPIELTRIGKWLERVPELRLDGERPTSRSLAARIASFWLPSQTVLYVGATTASVAARIAALEATTLGDRRPHAGGHWLRTLALPPTTRIWWAGTDAVEEYEDVLLTAFADALPGTERDALPDREVVLPFANLRRPTGERRATGMTGSLLPDPPTTVTPPTRVVVMPDGDADGTRDGDAPMPPRRSARPPATRPSRAASTVDAVAPAGPVATLTAEGAERMRSELETLVTVRRPEVIARIRTAKELGDLKENADYTAAREEQSFLEGRIQALEAQLRTAVIADAPVAGAGADLGSIVQVESDGVESTYTLVGSAEASVAAGRISVASPVGRALLGATAGDEIHVETPRGTVAYRVLAVD